MYRDKERYGKDPKEVIRTQDKTFNAALKWKEPRKIFTCSWSDFFIEDADDWRDEAWDVIRKTPHHTWQILTKRPERVFNCVPDDILELKNVWIGVSIESQDQILRMHYLRHIKEQYPNLTTFISFEPLISRIDIKADVDVYRWIRDSADWAIIGGESGNENGRYRYRPSHIGWYNQLTSDLKEIGKPVFVKQLGTYISKEYKLKDRHAGDISEFPDGLQIREMPHEN